MREKDVRLFHNPACSKSRQALELVREKGVEPEVVLYLDGALSPALLQELLAKLGIAAHALLRTKEAAYVQAGLSESSSVNEIIEAIVHAPILLERPILMVADKAVIGRPPEQVLTLL